jgi:dTDP-4-dehydrorhamnose reductase
VNTKAVQLLYENSEKFGSKLIHISTDYVFDGLQNSPYSENDIAKPVSFYGKSKLDGEQVLSGTDHVVIRPSVVYGWTPFELAGTPSSSGKPMNFALWVLTKLHANEPLKIVTATLADSLAESILKIAESKTGGIFHVSGLTCESRYDFTTKLAKKFGYDESLIAPVNSSEFKQKAKRPAYSCLNCQKAIDEFGLKLLRTEEALEIMKKQVELEAPHFLAKSK